jgi:hypothetical protein
MSPRSSLRSRSSASSEHVCAASSRTRVGAGAGDAEGKGLATALCGLSLVTVESAVLVFGVGTCGEAATELESNNERPCVTGVRSLAACCTGVLRRSSAAEEDEAGAGASGERMRSLGELVALTAMLWLACALCEAGVTDAGGALGVSALAALVPLALTLVAMWRREALL